MMVSAGAVQTKGLIGIVGRDVISDGLVEFEDGVDFLPTSDACPNVRFWLIPDMGAAYPTVSQPPDFDAHRDGDRR